MNLIGYMLRHLAPTYRDRSNKRETLYLQRYVWVVFGVVWRSELAREGFHMCQCLEQGYSE